MAVGAASAVAAAAAAGEDMRDLVGGLFAFAFAFAFDFAFAFAFAFEFAFAFVLGFDVDVALPVSGCVPEALPFERRVATGDAGAACWRFFELAFAGAFFLGLAARDLTLSGRAARDLALSGRAARGLVLGRFRVALPLLPGLAAEVTGGNTARRRSALQPWEEQRTHHEPPRILTSC